MVTKKEFITALVITLFAAFGGTVIITYILNTDNLIDYAYFGGTAAYIMFFITAAFMATVTALTYRQSRLKGVAFIK